MVTNRQNKFNELYPKRLANCIKAIKSLAKLSNKGNYSYEDEAVTKIHQVLMFTVKTELAKFGSSNVEQRYKRMIKGDLYEYAEIKQTDPQLFSYMQSKGLKNLDEAVDFVFEEQKKDSNNKLNIEEVLKKLLQYIEGTQDDAMINRDAIRELDGKIEEIIRNFGLRE